MPYVVRYLFILMSRQLALPETKRGLLSLSLTRTALPERHETCREIKAARGRTANPKRQ